MSNFNFYFDGLTPEEEGRRQGNGIRKTCICGLCCRCDAGAQLGNLRGGRRYLYDRKNEIIHGLSQSVVAPLFRDMSLAKVCNAGGEAPVAPLHFFVHYFSYSFALISCQKRAIFS